MNEINPHNELVKQAHDNWYKIAAIIIHKFKLPEVIITHDDIVSFTKDCPDCAILMHDKKDGIHLMLITDEQARKLAKEESETPYHGI